MRTAIGKEYREGRGDRVRMVAMAVAAFQKEDATADEKSEAAMTLGNPRLARYLLEVADELEGLR